MTIILMTIFSQKHWGQHPHLAANVLVDQVVLAFVVEDHMDFFGARATDVRTYG